MRAGGQTLTLLGAPRTYLILESLAEGTKGQLELRRDAGSPAQSTLRGHLRTLGAAKALVKHRRNSFPGTIEYELSEPGRELLEVALGLKRWLALAPAGPLELGSDPAKAAVKGLVEAWTTDVLTTLATGSFSLTELDKQIAGVSYPSIERCLDTLRLAELLQVGARDGRGTPYAVTDWLRRGLAPLILAARWEHGHGPEGTKGICASDIEGALRLAAPLLDLPAQLSGLCQLAARAPDDEKQRRFMGWVEVEEGGISYGPAYPQRKPDAWVSGTVDIWFSTVADGNTRGLRVSGDRNLARTLLEHLHEALFASESEELDQPADRRQTAD
jgi:DNA-binding HxlR family transcriptional regulator